MWWTCHCTGKHPFSLFICWFYIVYRKFSTNVVVFLRLCYHLVVVLCPFYIALWSCDGLPIQVALPQIIRFSSGSSCRCCLVPLIIVYTVLHVRVFPIQLVFSSMDDQGVGWSSCRWYTCRNIFIYVCVYIYIYIYVYIFLYIYIYIYFTTYSCCSKLDAIG